MSIITDALKKNQSPRTTELKKTHPEAKKENPIISKKNKKNLVIVLIVFLGGLLVYFSHYYTVTMPQAKHYLAPPKTYSQAYQKSMDLPFVVEPVEKKKIVSPVVLNSVDKIVNLNGIMYTPERPLVVINDSIWTEGDSVKGFLISEIGKDFVKVSQDGQEFILKLKRQ